MTKRCKEAECWTFPGKSTHSSWKIRLLLIIFGTYIQLNRVYMCSFVWLFKYFWATDTSDHWPFGLLTFRTNDPSDQWPFGLMNLRTNGLESWYPVPSERMGKKGSCAGSPWAKWAHSNLGMLCMACYLMFKHLIVYWKYQYNKYMFNFIDLFIFIPASGCVGRTPVHCFAWGPIMLLRQPWWYRITWLC